VRWTISLRAIESLVRKRDREERAHEREGDVSDKGVVRNELKSQTDRTDHTLDLDPERDRDMQPVIPGKVQRAGNALNQFLDFRCRGEKERIDAHSQEKLDEEMDVVRLVWIVLGGEVGKGYLEVDVRGSLGGFFFLDHVLIHVVVLTTSADDKRKAFAGRTSSVRLDRSQRELKILRKVEKQGLKGRLTLPPSSLVEAASSSTRS
jgi:hypothetical protein